MELLKKNWIRPLIEKVLRNLIDNPETGAFTGLQRGEEILPGYQESSNFRIPVRSKRCGQLIKCMMSGNVLVATLSDSFTSIECRFSREFVGKYEEEHNFKVIKRAKGAIIKLLQFEIVVDGLDTALYATEFEMPGCEGSQTIGNPYDIDDNKTTKQLLRDFARARGEWSEYEEDGPEDLEDSEDSDDESDVSMQSQPESNAVDSEPYQRYTFQTTSQEACQTQVPSHQVTLAHNYAAIATPIPKPKSNARDLLKRLQFSKGPDGGSIKPDTPSRQQRQSFLGKEAAQTSKAAAPVRQEEPVQRPTSLPEARKLPDINTRTPARPMSSNSYDKHVSQSAAFVDGRNYMARNVSEVSPSITGGRQESFDTPAGLPQTSVSDTFQPQNNPKHCDLQLPQNAERRPSYWGDMGNIETRDIYIPKDQQEMIDTPDSWVPPEAGKQMPQAHVPVDLLREWNKRAIMHRNAIVTTPARQGTPVASAEQQTPSSSGTQVTYWSQSPSQRVVLPADSSPPERPTRRPSKGHSNHSPINFTDQERLETQLPIDDDENAGLVVPRNTNGALTLPPVNILTVMGENSTDSEMETSIPTGLGHYPPTIDSSNVASSAPIPEQNQPSTQATPSAKAVPSGSQDLQPSETIEVPRSDNPCRVKIPQIPSDGLVPGTYESRNLAYPSNSEATRAEDLGDPMELDDDDMVTRQLNSELDSSVFSSHAPGQQDPFKAGITRSQITDRATQEEMVVDPASSTETEESCFDSANSSSPNKRKRDDSISSRPTKFHKAARKTDSHEATVSSSVGKESAPLDANTRFSFFAVEETSSAGQAIYDNFKKAYPEYAGDIKTFKRACRTLQALSDQGDMRRTVLWDDFIFRELDEYPNYIMECFRRQESPISYKAYFRKYATSARLKKRNLSAKKVATVVDDDTIGDADPESQATNDYIPSLGISQYSVPQTVPEVASEPFVEAAELVSEKSSKDLQESQVRDKRGSPGHLNDRLQVVSKAMSRSSQEPSHISPLASISQHTLETPKEPKNRSTTKHGDDSNDLEWHECDDSHEIASVDLGDSSRNITDVNDVDMEVEGSISSVDEAKYAAATVAEESASRSFSFHEVTEIEESDIDDTFRSAELDTSPKLARHTSKIPRKSLDSYETSKISEKAEGKQKSPGLGYPLAPARDEREDTTAREGTKSSHKVKPWWKYANAPFKLFARGFTALMNEGEGIPPPEVNEDGVIGPNNNKGLGEGPVRGRLSTMG